MSIDAKLERGLSAINAPVESLAVIDQKHETGNVDGALAFLRNEADTNVVDLDEKKLVSKIDWLVMPLLFGVYVLQYIDKSLSTKRTKI